MDENYLLSICIPTYNRASILSENLNRIFSQISGSDFPIEILVSDNCSTDYTETVVMDYIKKGMRINYLRNDINIGMERNFIRCLQNAKGKYVLILGDDDYLIQDTLAFIMSILEGGDYGLVHLEVASSSPNEFSHSADIGSFLKKISFWSTYVSSNIVNSKYISLDSLEMLDGTFLCITELYLRAAIAHGSNILVHKRIFEDGKDCKNSGGYNFFEVFIRNYLNIWKGFLMDGKITRNCYEYIKRDLYDKFLINRIFSLLVKKEKNRYILENSWNIILKTYWYKPYFYYLPIKRLIRKFF